MIISDILKDSYHPPFMEPTTPNPGTHCTSCGEVLSIYGHCWQCEYPPMDPKQDAKPQLIHFLSNTSST
jgi:hypothetical protein